MSNADTYREAVVKYNANDGRWEAIRDYYHPDFRLTAVDTPEVVTFDEMVAAFPEGVKFSAEVTDLVEYGDDLVARIQVTATQSGNSLTFEMIQWINYLDGLIAASKGYTNTPTKTKEFFDSLA